MYAPTTGRSGGDGEESAVSELASSTTLVHIEMLTCLMLLQSSVSSTHLRLAQEFELIAPEFGQDLDDCIKILRRLHINLAAPIEY
jgi:hypothetical protein